MDSSKHVDRMIQCVNIKVVSEILNRTMRHNQSPNLSTKLPRQSFERCNYVLTVNAAANVKL